MAAPVNTYTSQDQVGIREDLSDVISNIAPFETPWYSAIRKIKASNTLHEWQTDDLAAPSEDNAHVEGDDTVAEVSSPTTRLNNYCQIFKKSAAVSGTDTGLNKAGRAREMAYQIQKRTREMKTDMEKSMFANKAKSAGSGSSARVMAGFGAWVATNVNNVGAGGSNPTGDGSDARDDGTQTVFAQPDFDTTLQEIWEEGGKPEVVYLNASRLQTAINTFTGFNNQRSTLEASVTGNRNAIVNAVDVYVTPWGSVEFIPSRHVRERDVVILQRDKWAFANLRPVKNEQLAKTGDSEKRQLIAEGTLVCYNEKANGLVADASAA